MKSRTVRSFWFSLPGIAALLMCSPVSASESVPKTQASTSASETVLVAASDSSAAFRGRAQFLCDGEGDQEEINAAILSLPPAGGIVLLSAGHFDIRRNDGTLGGILISRSFVTLAGQGAATLLKLSAKQDVNVIRIIGSGVGHVEIRDLTVDGNREENTEGMGDPGISHDRFEFCGIKAFRQAPRGPSAAEDTHDITIRNCIVRNSHRLGIMLEGPNMRVIDNLLGNAGSDSVEILTGPGVIRGNIVEITGQTHVAIGSDRANSMIMSDNIIRVRKGGRLDIGFRSWAGSRRHVISDNVLVVDEGGTCSLAMDIRGTESTITGNNVASLDAASPTRIRFTAGNAVFADNVVENTVIEVDDRTGLNLPIVLHSNIMSQSRVLHTNGNLRQENFNQEQSPAESSR
ncbi:MAG: hypothetical protein ACK526_17675 [Planctomyces sp.]